MRLPWRRHRRAEVEPTPADEALKLSERQRDRAKQRRREFDGMAARWRQVREVNHLAEAFQRAFREGR